MIFLLTSLEIIVAQTTSSMIDLEDAQQIALFTIYCSFSQVLLTMEFLRQKIDQVISSIPGSRKYMAFGGTVRQKDRSTRSSSPIKLTIWALLAHCMRHCLSLCRFVDYECKHK